MMKLLKLAKDVLKRPVILDMNFCMITESD